MTTNNISFSLYPHLYLHLYLCVVILYNFLYVYYIILSIDLAINLSGLDRLIDIDIYPYCISITLNTFPAPPCCYQVSKMFWAILMSAIMNSSFMKEVLE